MSIHRVRCVIDPMITPKDTGRRRFLHYHTSIARDYVHLLPYAFKRFSVLRAFKTILPTMQYYCTRTPLPASDKPALFTMNILSPMMTVWYHLARKYLGDSVDIVIFESSGELERAECPGARVHKFLNFYAATKSEEFLRSIACFRKIGWLCDDDMFFVGPGAVERVEKELTVPRTASVSFRPRTWWEFSIAGRSYPPSSSYCIAYNREILIDRENLSLAPADGNNHRPLIGKVVKRYDTCDKANEILLQKGYRCAIIEEEERERYVTGFSGMSGAVMLLNYFRNPQETLGYFLSPPQTAWKGGMLPGALSGMLAICTIADLYAKLRGKRYPLPSLPERGELERNRDRFRPLLWTMEPFERVERVSERLRAAL